MHESGRSFMKLNGLKGLKVDVHLKDRPLWHIRTVHFCSLGPPLWTQLSSNLVKMPTMSKCFSMTQILTAKAIVIRINVKSSSCTFFSNKMSTMVNDEAYKDSVSCPLGSLDHRDGPVHGFLNPA